MALTFLAMQTEVYARGFSYLGPTQDTTLAGQTRVKRWLNDAAHKIDEYGDWPYLQATATPAPPPLTIADLRTVQVVTDVGNRNTLLPSDIRDLRDTYGDLTQAGTALYYYMTAGVISTFPVTTSTLTVDYWKVAADMVADGDTPAMPDRFRMAIVHYAVAMAHRDAANDAAAAAAQQDGDVLVAQMAASLLNPQHQGSSMFVAAVGDDT